MGCSTWSNANQTWIITCAVAGRRKRQMSLGLWYLSQRNSKLFALNSSCHYCDYKQKQVMGSNWLNLTNANLNALWFHNFLMSFFNRIKEQQAWWCICALSFNTMYSWEMHNYIQLGRVYICVQYGAKEKGYHHWGCYSEAEARMELAGISCRARFQYPMNTSASPTDTMTSDSGIRLIPARLQWIPAWSGSSQWIARIPWKDPFIIILPHPLIVIKAKPTAAVAIS